MTSAPGRRLRRAPRGRGVPTWALPLFGLLASGVALALVPLSGLHEPRATWLLVDRAGEVLGDAGAEESAEVGYWPLGEVPPRLRATTLAAEDRRLGWHPGVDLVAVARAAWQNLSSGRRVSGASTLAMQVARMQDPGPRRWGRKLWEAASALAMTLRHGSEAVLRQYLRLAPYGNRARGIAYAARRYFRRPVEDLGWAELAFLTALPQAPARRNPLDPEGRARAKGRAHRILDALEREGSLAGDELIRERRRLDALEVAPWAGRPAAALHPFLALARDLRAQEVAGGGLRRATLDLDLQSRAQSFLEQAVTRWQRLGVGNAALVVVELEGGRVRACVGSSGYFDATRAGAIDYSRVPRSSGSTLKPFLYALALDRDQLRPDQVLDDLGRAPGGLNNADGRFLGPLLPRVALANSRNVPAVWLQQRLGLPEVHGFLGDLGLHRGRLPPEHYGVGLGLGALPVTLLDLAQAYLALAGDGRLRGLRWLEGGESRPAAGRRVVSARSARRVTRWLSDPMARLPSFRRRGNLEYPYPVAVKTGTSQDSRDAWCLAFSRRYLVGAWVGHPDYAAMDPGVGGSGPAAFLVQQVLDSLHAEQLDGLSDLDFPAPEGSRAQALCGLSGGLAGARCSPSFGEHLDATSPAPRPCPMHREVWVDARTGRPAQSSTPPAQRVARTQVVVPPRYAAWAATGDGVERLGERVAGEGVSLVAPGAAWVPRDRRAERLVIRSPEPGLRVRIDPSAPPGRSTLALELVAEPPPERVVWMVDGVPFAEVTAPFGARWPLVEGVHRFEAQVPFTRRAAGPIRVTVAR